MAVRAYWWRSNMRTTSIAPADEPVARRNKASADESCRRVYTYDSDDALSAYIYNIWMAVLTVLPSVERHGTGLFAFIYAYDATQPPTTSWGLYSLAGQSQNSPSTFLYAYVGSQNPNNYAANSGVSCNSTDYDACSYTTSTSDVLVTLTYDRPPPRCNYAETGLYYYGHRYLSTETGRWVCRDPMGEKGYELSPCRPQLPSEIKRLRMVMRYANLPRWAAKQLVAQSLESITPQAVLYHFCKNNPVDLYDFLGLVDGPPGEIPFPGGEWRWNYPTGPVAPSAGPQSCPEVGQCISLCNAGAAVGLASCASICLLAEEGWWVCFMPCARVFTQARSVCITGCIIALVPLPNAVPEI